MEPLRDFFESLAVEWDSHQPPGRTSTIEVLMNTIEKYIGNPISILDVGTGTGAIIPVLKNHFPLSSCCSIDLATEMLLRARKRVYKANLVQADVHALPFSDQSFSTVICHNSFPHFSLLNVALSEINRSLKPGGIFTIIHDCSREKVNEVHQNAVSEVIHHHTLPSMTELCELLRANQFEPVFKVEDEEKFVVVTKKLM